MTPLLRFGQFEFDRDAFRLRRSGIVVPIEPKALALLQLLISHAPRVVDKPDIFAVVWKDVAVTDNALTRVVAHLRKALDDDPKQPRYIETVATRGYRWMAAIDEGADMPSAPPQTPPASQDPRPAATPRSRSGWLVAGVAAIAALAIAFAAGTRQGDRALRDDSTRRRSSVTELATLRPAQMSSGTGYDGFLAFSPDGKSIAFSSDRTGAIEVYVQGTAPGSIATALTSNGRQNVQPEWSPDSQFIAFHEMAGNGIWVAPSRGGVARKISDDGSNPVWSPDGRRIAFQSIPLTQVNTLGIPGVLGTIAVVSASGDTAPVAITTPGSPEGPHLNPAWLDADQVVFAAGQDGDKVSLWVTSASGGPARMFADDTRLGADYALSPDRTRVLFIARTTNTIWTMPIGRALSEEHHAEPTGLSTVGAYIGGLTMSADGRRLGWTSTEITGHVFAREGDKPSSVPKVVALTRGPGIRYTNPTPASDGRLLMTGVRPGSSFSLFMFDEGGEPRPLTPHPQSHGGSQWLPGEREVVDFAAHGEGGLSVYALDPATGRERRLFDMADLPTIPGSQASSAATPANLVFSRSFDRVVMAIIKDGRSNLFVAGLRDMKPDGTLVQKTFETAGGSYPTWSPDDKWIAYQCAEETDMHLCVVDAVTGQRTQITHEPGQSWVGGWGPDNDTIFFAARRGAVWNVAAATRTTHAVRQLTQYTDATSYVRYPKWDAAHQRVVYERSEAVGRTWSVTLPAP